jgi:hypothetical protein
MHARRRKKRQNYGGGIRTVEVDRGYGGFGFTISGQQPCIYYRALSQTHLPIVVVCSEAAPRICAPANRQCRRHNTHGHCWELLLGQFRRWYMIHHDTHHNQRARPKFPRKPKLNRGNGKISEQITHANYNGFENGNEITCFRQPKKILICRQPRTVWYTH